MTRRLAVLVLFVGMIAVVMGWVFIGLGMIKHNKMKEAMQVEQITLGIEVTELEDEAIDSSAEAQRVGDIIREHRWGIASTYSELLVIGAF